MTLCARCGENEATVKWGNWLAMSHGGAQDWCERCAVEEQTAHARERAAALPALEARLSELGGPAEKICSCIPAMLTVQECAVHGTIDFGARYVEANAGRVETSEELWESIGRLPSGEMIPELAAEAERGYDPEKLRETKESDE